MKRLGVWATLALLILSIPAYSVIPFWSYFGLDLQNLWFFHNCVEGARACGDPLGREMIYPPLLYWAFAWLRLVSFEAAVWIWDAFTVVGMTAAACMWIGKKVRPTFFLFWVLLLLQVPMIFALERGNNDALTVILWTAAAALFLRGNLAGSGFTAGTATMLKVYPAIPAVVIAAGLLREPRSFVRLAGGGLAAGALWMLIPGSVEYFTATLPAWSVATQPAHITQHAMFSVIHPAWQVTLIQLALLGIWLAASVRNLRADPIEIFAGALAISTYFARISNDYNLITVYPLLLLLFVRERWGWLLFGLFSTVGNRYLFSNSSIDWVKLHTLLQVLWLAGLGVRLTVPARERK